MIIADDRHSWEKESHVSTFSIVRLAKFIRLSQEWRDGERPSTTPPPPTAEEKVVVYLPQDLEKR